MWKRESEYIYSEQANSIDGMGKPLSKEFPFWPTLGESQSDKLSENKTMQKADIGFAIASPILLLKEGKRQIDIEIELKSFCLTRENINFITENIAIPSEIQSLIDDLVGVDFAKHEDFEIEIDNILNKILHPENHDLSLIKSYFLNESNAPLRHIASRDLIQSFSVLGSGVSNWVEIEVYFIKKTSENTLSFQLLLGEDAPAIIKSNHLKPHFQTSFPTLLFKLNHNSNKFAYSFLKKTQITNISISTIVNGVRNLLLKNDLGVIDGSKDFFPFGAQPSAGSSFYIGSEEIFRKKLRMLEIEWQWGDLPTNAKGFLGYYGEPSSDSNSTIPFSPYDAISSNTNFKAQFSILLSGQWHPSEHSEESGTNIELFDTLPGSPDAKLNQNRFSRSLTLPVGTQNISVADTFNSLTPNLKNGFAKLQLCSPDFGHKVFPIFYAKTALEFAKGGATTINLPNPPYTPKLTFFALNYEAELESTPVGSDNDLLHFFHLEPFGVSKNLTDYSPYFLPTIQRGALFIGLEKISPPQSISLLFQQLEGSGNSDIDIRHEDVKWQYLTDNGWKLFSKSSILIDETNSLQNTGIIELIIGSDASLSNPILPQNYYWLKVCTNKDPVGINKTTSIIPNAIKAEFHLESTQNNITNIRLPADKIKKLIKPIAAIKKIKQPFPSFGGRDMESFQEFSIRVSERLRHKKRLISTWDYERFVLSSFPEIFKVKCLRHQTPTSRFVPGAITLIVIPHLFDSKLGNSLEPKISTSKREKIKNYLQKYCSGFTQIYIENPKYERILIKMKIGLAKGYSGNYYASLLNKELKQFLSPWAFESGKDIAFNGRIYKSDVLGFVENRKYVDFIADFQLYHLDKGEGIGRMEIVGEDVPEDIDLAKLKTEEDFFIRPNEIGIEVKDYVEISSDRTILVSASEHSIVLLNPGETICSESTIGEGIGFMFVEVNFNIDE